MLWGVDLSVSQYRRELPETCVSFSSARGRGLFREALEAGTLETFFPLIEQFHTQADPAFCGLGSLVMALNALGVDPGRVWRGPWRWFSEELLDCCAPLERVRELGVSIEEVACLARCNGADVSLSRPHDGGLTAFRASVQAATRSAERVLIVSYSRGALGQTGGGHFSPIGGYHAERDLALVLDVARFKYPPHWVELSVLHEAMRGNDPVTERSRGWLLLQKRGTASAIAQFLVCRDGMGLKDVIERLLTQQAEAFARAGASSIEMLLLSSRGALEESGLLTRVHFRAPVLPEHVRQLEELSRLFGELPLYQIAARCLAPSDVRAVVLWWLAAPPHAWSALPEALAGELSALVAVPHLPPPLAREVALLKSQVEFLLEHARGASPPKLGDASALDAR